MNKNKKEICFVITPIGDNDSDIRKEIDAIIDGAIYPAFSKKFEVKVAHRNPEIDSINERIIKQIYDSKLIVANLTGLNPNVMYELGIAHALCKPVIMIARKDTKLPFDVISENTIFYTNGPSGTIEVKDGIKPLENSIDYSKNGYGQVYSVLKSYKIEERLLNQSLDIKEELITYWNNSIKRLETKIDTLGIQERENNQKGTYITNSNEIFGWKKNKIGWYFVGSDGKPVKEEWKKNGGYWFYLKDNGYIAINELVKCGEDYYYVDEFGRLFYDGFFVTERGLMYFGTDGRAFMDGKKVINGKIFMFKNGILE